MSTESQEASTSQFAQLLGAIQRVEANVDAKLSSMKRELKEERESADDRLVKKIRLDSKPTFKKKGHEQQFVYNEQVREKLVDNVRTALDQTPPAVEKIRSLVNEGEKLIDTRQKNIKIADRSEYGWATVAEYEEDELAANSGDEKRLQRAEQSAGRKQKSSKDVRKKGRFGRKPFKASWSHHNAGGVAELNPMQQSLGSAAMMQNLISQLQGPRRNAAGSGASQSMTLGPCFECGKIGHYKKSCPLLRGISANTR